MIKIVPYDANLTTNLESSWNIPSIFLKYFTRDIYMILKKYTKFMSLEYSRELQKSLGNVLESS